MPYITLQSDWQSLADKAFKAVNGDRGGAYAPTSPIAINGAGMIVTGPAEVNYGGILKTSASSRFKLGNNEWPKLATNHVGRTRVLRTLVHTRMATPRYLFADSPTYPGSLQTMALTVVTTAGLEQPKCHIPIRVHDGGRLVSGVVKIRVPTSRSKVPLAMPRLRIIRVDADGNVESLRVQSSIVDANGYSSFPTVTSGDAWYSSGSAQTWTFTCDQKNTIDTSLYVYYIEIIEEVGSSDPSVASSSADGVVLRERKKSVVYTFEPTTSTASFTGNPNPVISGPTIVTGDEVLVTTGPAAKNGVWVVDTGAVWTRRVDVSNPSDFTPGFLILDSNTGLIWECVSPIYGQSMNISPFGSSGTSGRTPIIFQKRVPRGNIYHSLSCTFDLIVDMRPQ